MKLIEKVAQKVMRDIVVKEKYGWPPACIGILYQPERPVGCDTHNDSDIVIRELPISDEK